MCKIKLKHVYKLLENPHIEHEVNTELYQKISIDTEVYSKPHVFNVIYKCISNQESSEFNKELLTLISYLGNIRSYDYSIIYKKEIGKFVVVSGYNYIEELELLQNCIYDIKLAECKIDYYKLIHSQYTQSDKYLLKYPKYVSLDNNYVRKSALEMCSHVYKHLIQFDRAIQFIAAFIEKYIDIIIKNNLLTDSVVRVEDTVYVVQGSKFAEKEVCKRIVHKVVDREYYDKHDYKIRNWTLDPNQPSKYIKSNYADALKSAISANDDDLIKLQKQINEINLKIEILNRNNTNLNLILEKLK